MDLNLSVSAFAAGLIFGVFGIYLFRLGRKRSHGLLVGIGIALMVYPYFVESAALTWIIGAVLTFFGYRLAL